MFIMSSHLFPYGLQPLGKLMDLHLFFSAPIMDACAVRMQTQSSNLMRAAQNPE